MMHEGRERVKIIDVEEFVGKYADNNRIRV